VNGKEAPSHGGFGNGFKQCCREIGHAGGAVTDVWLVLVAGGGQVIVDISLLIMGRTMPGTFELLAVFENFLAFLGGELASKVGHGRRWFLLVVSPSGNLKIPPEGGTTNEEKILLRNEHA